MFKMNFTKLKYTHISTNNGYKFVVRISVVFIFFLALLYDFSYTMSKLNTNYFMTRKGKTNRKKQQWIKGVRRNKDCWED